MKPFSSINCCFNQSFQFMLFLLKNRICSLMLLLVVTMDWNRSHKLPGSLLKLLVTIKFSVVQKSKNTKNNKLNLEKFKNSGKKKRRLKQGVRLDGNGSIGVVTSHRDWFGPWFSLFLPWSIIVSNFNFFSFLHNYCS